MPRGVEGIRQWSADVEARRNAGGGGAGALWFKLPPDEETVVRFLEQDDDLAYAYMHEIAVEGRQWGRLVPCCDQDLDGTPCPGCERDLARKFQGYINVIWDDAPIFKREDGGKLIRDTQGDVVVLSRKPQVAIWSSGIKLFEQLDEINTNYRGLMSRRFKVKRRGKGFDTKYFFSPEDTDSGPQEMSEQEKELLGQKYDLNEYIQPGSYEDFIKDLEGQNGGGGSNDAVRQSQSTNVFMRRNK